MPEGHLIHRYAREHEALLAGHAVDVSSPQGRFAEEASRLSDRPLLRVEPYGKHLFYWWDGEDIVHVHLGMQGLFLRVAAATPPRPQVRLRLATATGEAVDLIAPAACTLMTPVGREAIVARLGPDPLRPDGDAERVWDAVARSGRPIGALLLDQAVVSGVGNVLRAESLFAAGIHPSTPGTAVGQDEFAALWRILVELMERGRDEGRIITRRPPGVAPENLPESEARWVYKQERCRRCGSLVRQWELGGRTAYACPVDQPERDAARTGQK